MASAMVAAFLSHAVPRYADAMRAALLCLMLTACAFVGGGERHSPMAIYDAYLIAHGMVQSYDERMDADPTVSEQLASLDSQARRALINLAPGPGSDPEVTARAVAALSDYAARQASPTR